MDWTSSTVWQLPVKRCADGLSGSGRIWKSGRCPCRNSRPARARRQCTQSQQRVDDSRRSLDARKARLQDLDLGSNGTTAMVAELRLERDDLAAAADSELQAAAARRAATLAGLERGDTRLPQDLPEYSATAPAVRAEVARLRARSHALLREDRAAIKERVEKELRELEARATLYDSSPARSFLPKHGA